MNTTIWSVNAVDYLGKSSKCDVPRDWAPVQIIVVELNRSRDQKIIDWMVEAGIEFEISDQGLFRFIELRYEHDAVAFKLRFV